MKAYAFRNDDDHPCYKSFRDLRTRMVLAYGWRQPNDLVDGRDHDDYDLQADTVSIVLGATAEAVAGVRLTFVRGAPADSLSFQMWNGTATQISFDRRFADAFEAGAIVDMTRLVAEPNTSPSTLMCLLGASIGFGDGTQGVYFTAANSLRRLLDIMEIGYDEIAHGNLGGNATSLLVVYPEAWEQANAKGRALIQEGANMLSNSDLGELSRFNCLPGWVRGG